MSGVTQRYIYFYVDSQPLSIVIIEWVDDSDSQSENEPVQRSTNKPEKTKIKPVMLCAYSSYKASFEACFMDLGCLEKHNFSTALLENTRNHHSIKQFSVNSQKPSCFSTSVRFRTGCRRLMVVLNSFKVVIFATTTKVIVTTSDYKAIS